MAATGTVDLAVLGAGPVAGAAGRDEVGGELADAVAGMLDETTAGALETTTDGALARAGETAFDDGPAAATERELLAAG